MNRDLSAKPSLLAYANAARLLDGAEFGGWLEFDDPHTKGLLFESPDGDIAVLWNRADGYILNADHDPDGDYFPAPEVWEDPWPTKTPVWLTTLGEPVVEIDAIGRQRSIPVSGQTAQIVLDGAPRAFRGLRTTPGSADSAADPAASNGGPRLVGLRRS